MKEKEGIVKSVTTTKRTLPHARSSNRDRKFTGNNNSDKSLWRPGFACYSTIFLAYPLPMLRFKIKLKEKPHIHALIEEFVAAALHLCIANSIGSSLW